MKNLIFVCLLLLCFTKSYSQGQIGAVTQSLNCYNDSATIFVFSNPSVTILNINWQYSKFDPLFFMDTDTVDFITLSINNDSLWTTKCGWYKAVYTYNSFGTILIGNEQFSIGCRLTIGQGQNDILCFGDSTGSLKRPVFGGDPFFDNNGNEYYNYQWIYADDSLGNNSYFFSDTGDVLENASSGWYKTVVIDSLNCSDTIGFLEFKDPPIIIIDTISTQSVICRSSNTASISYHIFGGKKYSVLNKYFYYLILNGDTVGYSDTLGYSDNFSNFSLNNNLQVFSKDSIRFDSLSSGQYFLHVIDSNSCLMIDTVLLNPLLPYEVFSSTNINLQCSSDSAYLKIDSILSYQNILYGFNYDLTDGIHVDSIYVSSGIYPLYVQDTLLGCFDTVFIACESESNINVFETITHIDCFNNSSGRIEIDSINGGFYPYDIQWGNINNLALSSGSYQLNIVDSIGCLHIENYFITESDQIILNSTLYSPSCYGDSNGSISIDVFGGTGNLDFSWLHNMSGNDSIFGLIEDTYSVVVSDSLSCIDTFDIILSQADSIIIDPGVYQNSLDCFGLLTPLNLTILGGTFPYSILWNDLDTNHQRIIPAGLYSVVVSDVNNCSKAYNNILITQPDSLSISISATETSCFEDATASVYVNGGVEPISYLWSTGDTTSSIDSLSSSIYWVVVTDSCGNSISDTIYISEYELITSSYYTDSSHVASVEVLNSSNSGPFNHYWIDATGDTVSEGAVSLPICEGTYYVITVDLSNNCTDIDTLQVEFFLPLASLIDISTTTVLDDIDLWGSEPYTYLWDNGSVAIHADLCPGQHFIEVTDKYNCTLREDFEIEAFSISLDPPNIFLECNLENLDVSIQVLVSGATEPYSFLWSTGSTENPIDIGMSPGNLDLQIIDNNGCIEDTSLTIRTISPDCIPDIFTPNGDAINDSWNLENTFLYDDSEIVIYGRYGKIIYQSIGYNNAWDGTNKSGKDVPEGVYFYCIQIGHGFNEIQGTVTILR